jgi:hypothetical protein
MVPDHREAAYRRRFLASWRLNRPEIGFYRLRVDRKIALKPEASRRRLGYTAHVAR